MTWIEDRTTRGRTPVVDNALRTAVRLLGAVAADEAHRLAHVQIVLVPKRLSAGAKDGKDPPSAGMADRFRLTRAPETHPAAVGRCKPGLQLVRRHVDCGREVAGDPGPVEQA